MIILCKDHTDKIQKLRLQDNLLAAIDLTYFSRASWSSLVILRLDGNKISRKGCKYLSRTVLNNLRVLGLTDNLIQSVGIKHLSKLAWPSLQKIDVQGNKIGREGVESLIRFNAKILTYLSLFQNQLIFEQLRIELLSQINLCQIQMWDNKLNVDEKKRVKTQFKLKFIAVNVSY